jgi:hypothetical protein
MHTQTLLLQAFPAAPQPPYQLQDTYAPHLNKISRLQSQCTRFHKHP